MKPCHTTVTITNIKTKPELSMSKGDRDLKVLSKKQFDSSSPDDGSFSAIQMEYICPTLVLCLTLNKITK